MNNDERCPLCEMDCPLDEPACYMGVEYDAFGQAGDLGAMGDEGGGVDYSPLVKAYRERLFRAAMYETYA